MKKISFLEVPFNYNYLSELNMKESCLTGTINKVKYFRRRSPARPQTFLR